MGQVTGDSQSGEGRTMVNPQGESKRKVRRLQRESRWGRDEKKLVVRRRGPLKGGEGARGLLVGRGRCTGASYTEGRWGRISGSCSDSIGGGDPDECGETWKRVLEVGGEKGFAS